MAIQDKFNKSNHIYKITKDIDLEGVTLNIPAGCILDFQGGKFINGVIRGNNTSIKAGNYCIFDSETTTFAGTWKVKEYNASWSGVSVSNDNNRSYIEHALEFCYRSGAVLFIDQGTYKIRNTIYIKYSNTTIKGVSSTKTILDTDNLDIPIIASIGYPDKENSIRDVIIQDIQIKFKANDNRSENPVCLVNVQHTQLYNVRFECQPGSNTSVVNKNVVIKRTPNASYANFMTVIRDCVFNNVGLLLHSTDSIITDNFFWGNKCEYACQLGNCSNTIFTNNELVGGTKGAIYIPQGEQFHNMKIANNYFDGSYAYVNTGWGINCEGEAHYCIINGNNFWKQKLGAIKINDSRNVSIIGNNFYSCDCYAEKVPDIDLYGKAACCIILGNTFSREEMLNSAKSEYITRTTEFKAPIINIANLESYQSYIENNCVYGANMYESLTYTGYVSADNNNTYKLNRFDKVGEIFRGTVNSNDKGTTFLFTRKFKYGIWDGSAWNYCQLLISGTSGQRPVFDVTTNVGFQFFDITLNKPIWWTGTKWVDSTGADV